MTDISANGPKQKLAEVLKMYSFNLGLWIYRIKIIFFSVLGISMMDSKLAFGCGGGGGGGGGSYSPEVVRSCEGARGMIIIRNDRRYDDLSFLKHERNKKHSIEYSLSEARAGFLETKEIPYGKESAALADCREQQAKILEEVLSIPSYKAAVSDLGIKIKVELVDIQDQDDGFLAPTCDDHIVLYGARISEGLLTISGYRRYNNCALISSNMIKKKILRWRKEAWNPGIVSSLLSSVFGQFQTQRDLERDTNSVYDGNRSYLKDGQNYDPKDYVIESSRGSAK